MDFHGRDGIEQLPAAEAPEDVAALYSWANLHGAKYKDLSAAQSEAVEPAGEVSPSVPAAADPEATAEPSKSPQECSVVRESAERPSGPSRGAQQTTLEAGDNARPESTGGSTASDAPPGITSSIADPSNSSSAARFFRRASDKPARSEQSLPVQRSAKPNARSFFSAVGEGSSRGRRPKVGLDLQAPDEIHGTSLVSREGLRADLAGLTSGAVVTAKEVAREGVTPFPNLQSGVRSSGGVPFGNQAAGAVSFERKAATGSSGTSPQQIAQPLPAWLYSTGTEPEISDTPFEAPSLASVADTLQHSRERVASRWFALKGIFEHPGKEREKDVSPRQKEVRTPALAIFSLAGGVGKTSLVATLGRSLSSVGEKVLLADTTSHGLLPYYFGASELRQGVVRTFSPPSGSTDAPIYLVSYDLQQHVAEAAAQDQLAEEIALHGRGTHRILLDLSPSSGWILRRMTKLDPTLLVPVAPDMNSVITLQAVERFAQGLTSADGQPIRPYYLLNQFDAALPLHLDVREVLRRQLGERLLPFVIRRATSVSEALAEGMTILDYSPDSPVVEDFETVATWLRNVAAPATAGFRNVRWSER